MDIEKLINDDAFCEALAEKFYEEFKEDDLAFDKKGRAMLEAWKNGDVNRMLIAICGWSMETLVEKAQEMIGDE